MKILKQPKKQFTKMFIQLNNFFIATARQEYRIWKVAEIIIVKD